MGTMEPASNSIEHSVSKESVIFQITSKRAKRLIMPRRDPPTQQVVNYRDRPSIPHLILTTESLDQASHMNADTQVDFDSLSPAQT